MSEAAYAVRLGVTSIVAIALSMALELQTPAWAGWTVLSVSLATRASSLQKSMWRAGGSIAGAIISFALVAGFAQSTLAFDIALALWLALAAAGSSVERGQRSYGFALLGFTVPIVTLANVNTPLLVFGTAVDRCSTLLLGIACAHASSGLVAQGVATVSFRLAAATENPAAACQAWLRASEGPPPIATVLGLEAAVADAFTEQSSLRTGGRPTSDAPIRLLRLVAAGLLGRHLGSPSKADPGVLLGFGPHAPEQQLRRVLVGARLMRAGRRLGGRVAPTQSLAIDRDGRQAFNNAIRTAVAVSALNAFWYASEWPYGASAVTWAALLSALFAARPDAARATLNFLIGAALASVVGVFLHYGVLTASGSFWLLAAVLLPVCMMAAIARYDRRAAIGSGYAMVVLNILAPDNIMHYQLDQTLNEVLADLLGMGTAVVAFGALPPPASPATRRWRAKRRMARGLRVVACWPRLLLPSHDRWLGRMSDRLAQLAPEDAEANRGGQTLLLAGSLLLAVRREDDQLGRDVGAAIWGGKRGGAAALRVTGGLAPLQRERLAALTTLLDAGTLAGWPGLPPGLAR